MFLVLWSDSRSDDCILLTVIPWAASTRWFSFFWPLQCGCLNSCFLQSFRQLWFSGRESDSSSFLCWCYMMGQRVNCLQSTWSCLDKIGTIMEHIITKFFVLLYFVYCCLFLLRYFSQYPFITCFYVCASSHWSLNLAI